MIQMIFKIMKALLFVSVLMYFLKYLIVVIYNYLLLL
jgi:hypothetical protein